MPPARSSGIAYEDGLSREQLAKLEAVCRERQYAPGAFIVREGDTDPFVHIVVDGRAELVKASTLGAEALRIRELREGDVVGELKIVDREPSSASVVAVTPVTALAIDLEAFDREPVLVEGRASVLENVGKIMADRLRRTTTQGADAMYRELQDPTVPGRTNWKAIVIANLLFASAHAYIGFWFCVFAFLPGLFWGWLFARQRSLVGVTVSHILVGLWAIFALGIHAVIGGG